MQRHYDDCYKLLRHCKPSHYKVGLALIVGLELRGFDAPTCRLAYDQGVLMRWQQVEVVCWDDLVLIDSPSNRYSSYLIMDHLQSSQLLDEVCHVLGRFPDCPLPQTR